MPFGITDIIAELPKQVHVCVSVTAVPGLASYDCYECWGGDNGGLWAVMAEKCGGTKSSSSGQIDRSGKMF